MTDIDLKTLTPDTSLPTTGFLFGADSQAASSPSVYSTQTVATTLLGSTTLSGATVTTSQPVLDLSQIWNNAGVTFTGLKFNAAGSSDANSASGSLLMQLQTGGVDRFSFGKSGNFFLSGAIVATGKNPSIIQFAPLGTVVAGISETSWQFGSSMAFTWSPDAVPAGTGSDLLLTRRGPANLRLGNTDAATPVAQTLSVQSVVAGTTNTAGANLTITGSQGTGSGAGGSIIFQVAPAGSSGTAQNALAEGLRVGLTSGTNNGTGVFVGAQAFAGLIAYDANTTGLRANGGWGLNVGQGFVRIATAPLQWGADFNSGDTILTRDGAANTLALRNGTNGQEQRTYGTYTDTSNYRRVAVGMSNAGVGFIRPEGAGTGASGNVIHISGLPTSNPGPGILWNNAGTPAIGT